MLGRSGVVIRFGAPLDFSDRTDDMSSMRAITDEIVTEIQKLSGQEYTGTLRARARRSRRRRAADPG